MTTVRLLTFIFGCVLQAFKMIETLCLQLSPVTTTLLECMVEVIKLVTLCYAVLINVMCQYSSVFNTAVCYIMLHDSTVFHTIVPHHVPL